MQPRLTRHVTATSSQPRKRWRFIPLFKTRRADGHLQFYNSVAGLERTRYHLCDPLAASHMERSAVLQLNNDPKINKNNKTRHEFQGGIKVEHPTRVSPLVLPVVLPEVECGIGFAPPSGKGFRPAIFGSDKRTQVINTLIKKGIVKPHKFSDYAQIRCRYNDVICEFDADFSSDSFRHKAHPSLSHVFSFSRAFIKTRLADVTWVSSESKNDLISHGIVPPPRKMSRCDMRALGTTLRERFLRKQQERQRDVEERIVLREHRGSGGGGGGAAGAGTSTTFSGIYNNTPFYQNQQLPPDVPVAVSAVRRWALTRKRDPQSPVTPAEEKFLRRHSLLDRSGGGRGKGGMMGSGHDDHAFDEDESQMRALGIKTRFAGELCLSTDRDHFRRVFAPFPFTNIEYRYRRVYSCPDFGVEIHVTSSRPMRVRSGKHQQKIIGHLGSEARIVLNALPFFYRGGLLRGKKTQGLRAGNRLSSISNRDDGGGSQGDDDGDGDGSIDEHASIISTMSDSPSSSSSSIVDAVAGDTFKQQEAYWGGHSRHSTIEIEMVQPLLGDPLERMRALFDVAHETLAASS